MIFSLFPWFLLFLLSSTNPTSCSYLVTFLSPFLSSTVLIIFIPIFHSFFVFPFPFSLFPFFPFPFYLLPFTFYLLPFSFLSFSFHPPPRLLQPSPQGPPLNNKLNGRSVANNKHTEMKYQLKELTVRVAEQGDEWKKTAIQFRDREKDGSSSFCDKTTPLRHSNRAHAVIIMCPSSPRALD
jgi:hypothetical protein